MPSASAASTSTRAQDVRAIRWMRACATLLVALVIAACALLLAVRFVVFPHIEDWRDDIAARLADQFGQSVEIDRIATGWDGWNPKLDILGFRIRDRAGNGGPALLELPRVELVVGWTSLVFADLVLKELAIENPRLAVRRSRDGRLSVAGIDVGAGRSDDGRVTAWLLRQPSIAIRNALITWDDEQRGAPQLVLDRVHFRLERQFGVHRFGLTGEPPAEVASPLDLRGEWSGGSPRDWREAKGRLYVRFDYADVVPLREWLPLPAQIESGKGALRFWFDIGAGAVEEAIADVELAEVSVRAAPKLAPIELRRIAGHFEYRERGAKQTLTARGLEFTARNGTMLVGTDASVSLERDAAARIAGGEVSVAALELAPLATLGPHLPIPDAWREHLATLAPRGLFRNARFAWQGAPEAPTGFSASGTFQNLAVAPDGPFPGVSAITGSFETTQARGTIKLTERAATIALPRLFEDPLAFDRLRATAHWEQGPEGAVVRIEDLAFANAHAAGSLAGRWHATGAGPGAVDIAGTLSRMDISHVWRYVPVARTRLRDWMERALVKGAASEGKFTLSGPLAQSPFAPDTAARLTVAARIQGATFDYARNWPAVLDLDGDLRIDGRRLTFVAARGQVFGTSITRGAMEIPELRAPGGAVLRLDLEAAGPTAGFLEFIANSPVTGYLGRANDGVQATGEGALALKLDLGLARQKPPEVAGSYTFTHNVLRIPRLPPLGDVNGRIAFTEKGLQASDLAAEMLGGPAKFAISKADERVRIAGSGTANLALLRTQFPVPLADRLSGTTDWQLAATLLPRFLAWQLESSLKGAAVDLPAPLGKAAQDVLPLRVERRQRGNQTDRDTIAVELRNTARVTVQRRLAGPETSVERVLALIGKATERPGDAERNGIWVRADVPALDVDDWLAFARRDRGRPAGAAPAGAAPTGPSLEGVEIEAGTLDATGRRFQDVKLTARAAGEDWRMTLSSTDIAGTAVWRGATPAMPNGRLIARLTRLGVPGDRVPPGGAAKPAAPATERTVANWPELDITADSLTRSGRDLGRLELFAKPAGPDWRIDKLAIANPAGSVTVNGLWRPGAAEEQTKLDVKLEAADAGEFLARFGYVDALDGAPTTIEGQLAWNGPPASIDFPTLGGNFRLTAGAGRFTKIDPGIGKLIGVLSLQALPRRMTLDFRDVFSDGFVFDEILGRIRIHRGVMHSDDLKINGLQAKVDISGEVDLGRETQELRVQVIPGIGGVSAGTAALLIAANPIIGGALVASSLVAESLGADQAFAFEYRISGRWSDPVVQRVQAKPIVLPGDGTGR